MSQQKDTYTQRSFFQTGMPFLAAAIVILVFDLWAILHKFSLLLALLLLVVGITLIVLGLRSGKQETMRILRFIQDNSTFRHKCDQPLTPDALLERLKGESFSVTGYPYGNWYCHRQFGGKFDCHFFLTNDEEPEIPETTAFAELFVRTFLAASLTPGQQYVVNLKYGPGLEQRSSTYLEAVRKGFMYDKHGILFGYHLACDTQEDTLYCAEAVSRVVWQKNDVFPIYLSGLLQRLFFRP